MKRHSNIRGHRGGASSILLGVFINTITLVCCALIGGGIVSALENPMGAINVAFLSVFMLSAAISAIINTRTSCNSSTVPIVCAGVFILIILCIALITESGKIGLGMLMNYLCYMLVSALFSFIGRKRGKRHR